MLTIILIAIIAVIAITTIIIALFGGSVFMLFAWDVVVVVLIIKVVTKIFKKK